VGSSKTDELFATESKTPEQYQSGFPKLNQMQRLEILACLIRLKTRKEIHNGFEILHKVNIMQITGIVIP
jgi:hypothetical protein